VAVVVESEVPGFQFVPTQCVSVALCDLPHELKNTTMLKLVILAALATATVAIAQVAPPTTPEVQLPINWNTNVTTGIPLAIIGWGFWFLFRQIGEKDKRIDALHSEKELIYRDIVNKNNEIMAEVRDALRALVSTKIH